MVPPQQAAEALEYMKQGQQAASHLLNSLGTNGSPQLQLMQMQVQVTY